MESGAKVHVVFDFIASAPDELPLQSGDVVVIQQKVDHDWLIGSCNGQSGTFPANFVELVADESAASSLNKFARGQKVVSVETFSAGTDGDLSFTKGDVIEITKQIDDNWLEGRLGNETGIFPVMYVSAQSTQHVSTPGDILQARALKDNCGKLQDELSFQMNDIITITETIDQDWYRGMLNGKTGTLPAVSVAIVKQGDTAQSSATAILEVGKDSVDYNVVNERLRSAMQGGRSSAPSSPKIGNSHDAEPWAKAMFPFIGEHPGEISLIDGDRVTLRRRVDDNWLEGEVGGNVGIFPSNYVQIQVDIPEGYLPPVKPASNSFTSKPQTLPVPSGSANNNNLKAGTEKWKGKRGKVLFDFSAVTDQDLGVKQGDYVTIIDKVDADWVEAKHSSGRTGFLPVNYVKVLEKPRTPSFKRPAPLPPKQTPSPVTQNGSTASSTNSIDADLLDIFSTLPETTEKPDTNAKPPLPPKSAKVLSTEKPKAPSAIDDLLCFDPLGDNLGDTSPHILPEVQPLSLKPQSTSDQVGFKLGGGAYRPVLFAAKQSPPDDTASKPSSTANPFSNIKSAEEPQRSQGHSLMDMSPVDKPSTSILAPLSAPLSPPPLNPANVSQPPTSKPPLQRKQSYELFSAKPFSPLTTTQIHSVARPGSQGLSGSPTSPQSPKSPKLKQVLLTPMQVSRDLDRALCEVDASSSPLPAELSKPKFNPFSATDSAIAPEILPPVPPRQPSPNPFSAENKVFPSEIPPPLPPRQPSPNPFKAESPPLPPPPSEVPPPIITSSVPQTIQPLNPTPAPKPQLPPPRSTSNPPCQKPSCQKPPCQNPPCQNPPCQNPPCQNPPVFRPVALLRDDSIASDFSDDYLMQNINFSIRPSNSDFQAPTAFKLPPPPTKSTIKASTVESPRSRRKFNPKSAVPRPRGRSLDREGGSSSEDYELPPDQSSQANREKFQQDLRCFQASVNQMFDPRKFEANEDNNLFGMPQREPPPPPDAVAIVTDQTASLLDGVFEDFSDTVPSASTTQTSESSALGLGLDPPATSNVPASESKIKGQRSGQRSGRTPPGRPKEPAPKKKSMPPRQAPPKFGPGHKTAEDELLAKLRPEGNNEVDFETQETMNALQGSIAELKEAIAVQHEQKKTYEEMLQEAAAEEIEDMEQQLVDCIGTIENMNIELQTLEEQLQEVRPSPAPESKMTVTDFREKVITELVKTEQDYVRDIKLCQEGFMAVLKDKQDIISQSLIQQQLEEIERTGEKKPTKGLELEILFGNMEQVIETAEKFLKDLEEATEGTEPEEQLVGQVFMRYSNDLHKVYAEYCHNHDDATTILEKYEENEEVQEYINQGLELVRQSTNCWDLASFLIKPVQRILKYQLLLGELDKYTDDSFLDKPNLQEAIQTMTEVAKAINEFKRRKDLVMKYRRPGQEAIADKLGRISLHSIRKKSQRINQRLNRMTGLTTQTVDGDFDQTERRFKNLEKTIRIFVKDVNAYLEQLKDATSSEAAVGSDISDYYASQSNLHEVNKYEAVQRHLANKLYKDYTLFVQQRVISPLNGLLIMFQGPHKLIDKRYDKLLDYDSFSNKLEKNKDKDRVKQHKIKDKEEKKELEDSDDDATSVGSHKRLKERHRKELKDENEIARKNYEALNIQLKDELPKLCDMGLSLFKSCVVSFVEAERDHINSTLKKLYPLLELSIVQTNSTIDIMQSFEASHTEAVEDMHKFSFVPKSLDKKGDRRSVYGTSSEPTPPPSAPRPDPSSQSDKQKANINSRYPADRVYQVSIGFSSQQPMDISVKKGEIVGIIKEQDPTGSGQRWYIDNGESQGFIPSAILEAVGGEITSPEGYGSDDDWNTFTKKQQQAQYYYAEWEFTASAVNELSLAERDVVQLISDRDIEGNSEWWLVDKNGQRGYVPSAYLAKIE